MTAHNIHVLPHGSGWDVIQEGSRYANSHHASQEDAVEAGTRDAQREQVELLIHGLDGQIRTRSSFGHEPRSI